MKRLYLLILLIISLSSFEGIITQARGSNGVFSGKCIMRVSNFNILLKSHFDDISINQSYQVTAGRVIADRDVGAMINIDEIINQLDSLADVSVDSISVNPDNYLDDLEIIYVIEPEQVNDSLIETLDEIYNDLQELAETEGLTDDQIQEIEDLLEQIDILSDDEDKNFVKPGDKTIYVKTKFDKYKLYKSGETIFVNKEPRKTQKCYIKKYFVSSGGKTYKFLGTLRADWYIDKTRNGINTKSCAVSLDSTGIYNLKACINYTSGDTISILDTVKVNINIIDKPIVFFDKHKTYKGEYGFEKYEHPEFMDDMSLEKIKVNNLDYYVPWLSLKNKQTANLDVIVFVPSLYSGLEVKFESSDPSIILLDGIVEYDSTSLKQGYNKFSILVRSKDITGFNNFCPVYVKNENDSIIGKINVVSEKEDNYTGFNLTLVKVITDTFNRPINLVKIKTNLQKKLKDFSYKQAFVKWVDINYDTLDLTGVIDSRYLSKVESEYNKSKALRDTLINWYKIKKGGRLKKKFFVFIVDKEGAIDSISGGKLSGRAKWPKKGEDNYLVIYYQAKENYDTYIHELGHNFNLQHPFGQFPSIQKHSTKNIMDYGRKRNYFWLWQCKQIRNFEFID